MDSKSNDCRQGRIQGKHTTTATKGLILEGLIICPNYVDKNDDHTDYDHDADRGIIRNGLDENHECTDDNV